MRAASARDRFRPGRAGPPAPARAFRGRRPRRRSRAVRRACELVAERVDGRRRRADEDQPGVLDRTRERRLARRGSHSRGGPPRRPYRVARLDHGVDPQVALGRRAAARAAPRRRRAGRAGRGVRVAVDGDGLDAHLPAGTDDAHGDLAPIGDQDAAERWRRPPAARLCAKTCRRVRAGCCRASSADWCRACPASISSAPMSRGRVSDGRMTSST